MEVVYPVLRPLTSEARASLQRDEIVLRSFPFRVGRESRFGLVHGKLRSMERRQRAMPPNNDLYLIDNEELLNISREHFQIELADDGSYAIVDRGSTCGTIVDGAKIGRDASSVRCRLKSGTKIVVGLPDSPYVFEFHCGS